MVQAVKQLISDDFRDARQKVVDFLCMEIDFVMNPSFSAIDRKLERHVLESRLHDEPTSKVPRNLPGHLARLCEAKVLTAEEEKDLFRRMNYLKYRANSLRARLDPQRPDMRAVHHIERFLAAAQDARDRLIRANMRLAISIVKKFVNPRHAFDDLLSEGIFSLMQAVNKFDYGRGFRFSTYAYRAIARNTYRLITKSQNEAVRYSADMEGASTESIPDSGSSSADVDRWVRLRETMSTLVHRLERREQLIIRCRYALGAHRKVKTFQTIADKLGVSKERVRQLEQRAMGKLRMWAAELDLEDTVEPSLS